MGWEGIAIYFYFLGFGYSHHFLDMNCLKALHLSINESLSICCSAAIPAAGPALIEDGD